ncbi:fibronectin type III domain-containing protein [Petrachloros mirabilis]
MAWDPVQDPTVTGYYVHYGLQSANSAGSCAYTQSSFSSSPAATVTGLAPNTTYYFAVSAYNGLESTCSTEVSTFTQQSL